MIRCVWILPNLSHQDHFTVHIPAGKLTWHPIVVTTLFTVAMTMGSNIFRLLQVWMLAELSHIIVVTAESSKSTRYIERMRLSTLKAVQYACLQNSRRWLECLRMCRVHIGTFASYQSKVQCGNIPKQGLCQNADISMSLDEIYMSSWWCTKIK